MSDRFVGEDGTAMRILGNSLLVRPDPEPKISPGGIHFVQDPTLYHIGEVLAVGYVTSQRAAYKTPIPGLKVGDRVLYVRFLEATDINPKIKSILGDNVISLRPADILLTLDEEDVSRLR